MAMAMTVARFANHKVCAVARTATFLLADFMLRGTEHHSEPGADKIEPRL